MSSLSVRGAAADQPDRTAFIGRARSLSFRELLQEVEAHHERLLRGGWSAGQRVLFAPRPTLADASVLSMLIDRRIPTVLVHPRWTTAELDDVAKRAGASVTLTAREVTRTTHRAEGRAEEGEITVFSSGSTGRPRGILLSASSLSAAAAAHRSALPPIDGEAWELSLPLNHVGGLSILTRSLFMRTAVVFEGAAPATLSSLVPTMLRQRSRATTSPPELRAVLIGGAPCPDELLAAARRRGYPCLPTYGMSETCGQVCTQRLGAERPSGVGPPLPGWEVQLEDGEILVRGPSLLSGWLDGSAALRGDGFYRTGDGGRVDEAGHLHVIGRLDDRIISGGENIDPREVERALLGHPGVEDAAVLGVPDERWGQAVVAAVKTDREDDELWQHLAARLARFKHPKRFVRLEALPLLPNGKLDRHALRALFTGGRGSGGTPASGGDRGSEPRSAAGAGSPAPPDRSADRGR